MEAPEWSASAMVLFGLTIVKLFRAVQGSGKGGGLASNWDRVAVLALAPLLGLVFTIVTAAYLLSGSHAEVYWQFAMLATAIVLYFVLAGYAERKVHMA